jgi:hypothetical protein
MITPRKLPARILIAAIAPWLDLTEFATLAAPAIEGRAFLRQPKNS